MTIPIFDTGVPERFSDALATTQPELLNNFISLYQAFLKNHVAISETGAGNHTIIELLEQGGDPQTGLNDISFYSKNVEGQTDQVFVRMSSNGTAYQLSNYQLYSMPHPTDQQNYFTILPGKLLVYFGYFNTLPDNILLLNPPIAKNIVSVDFCPHGFGANLKPTVEIIKDKNAEITKLKVADATLGNTTVPNGKPPGCYYMVVANI